MQRLLLLGLLPATLALGSAPAWAQSKQEQRQTIQRQPVQQQTIQQQPIQQQPIQKQPIEKQAVQNQPIERRAAIKPAAGCNGSAKALYHLKAGATQGNGSVNLPFGTLAEALNMARQIQACSLELRMATGVYVGDIVGFGPTILLGWTTDSVPPRPVLQGRIENSPGRTLTVRDLSIRGGAGVHQRGGSLTLERVSIQSSGGIGLQITDGAQAKLNVVDFNSNNSAGLSVAGAGTTLQAQSLVVATSGTIGLEIMGGAQAKLNNVYLHDNNSSALIVAGAGTRLQAQSLVVQNNRYMGVHIRESAKAHLRNAKVSGTHALAGDPLQAGGTNIAVSSGAVLEIHDFQSTDAALSGLSIYDSYATAVNGILTNNEIGFSLGPRPRENYRPRSCVTNVRSFSNRSSDLADVALDLPNAACVLDSTSAACGAPTVCETVPWSP